MRNSMQLKDKIELIKILSNKLCLEKAVPEIFRDGKRDIEMMETVADETLEDLKKMVIEKMKRENELTSTKTKLKKVLKAWCDLHNIDYKILNS